MDKEEILSKARVENKGADLVDEEARKDGSWIAYIVGVVLLVVVDAVNAIVFYSVNRGPDFALFSMASALFIFKYVKTKSKHDLILSLILTLLAIVLLVVWILQLCGVIR